MNWVKGIPPRYMRDHLGAYTGGDNRLGWHGEMDRCWLITMKTYVCAHGSSGRSLAMSNM